MFYRKAYIQLLKADIRVRELHKPFIDEETGKVFCEAEECYSHVEYLERDDCDCDYPCPTIKALDGEQ